MEVLRRGRNTIDGSKKKNVLSGMYMAYAYSLTNQELTTKNDKRMETGYDMVDGDRLC